MIKYTKVMKMKEKIALAPEEVIRLRLDAEFRRLTGVWPRTFNKMVEILKVALVEKSAEAEDQIS
jgi:hypothetical protein